MMILVTYNYNETASNSSCFYFANLSLTGKYGIIIGAIKTMCLERRSNMKFRKDVFTIVMAVILMMSMGFTVNAAETQQVYEEPRITEEADVAADPAESEAWAWVLIIWMASWVLIPGGPVLMSAVEDIVEKRRKKNKISLEK